MHNFTIWIVCIVFVFLARMPSYADTIYQWTNDSSSTWGTASNWDRGAVPNGSDHVVTISRPSANPIITYNSTATVKSLTSDEQVNFTSGSLTILNTSTFNSAVNINGGTLSGGTLYASTVNVNSSSSNRMSGVNLQANLSLADSSDRLNVSGGLTVASGSKVTIGSSSLLYFDTGSQTFSGEVQMNSGSNLQNVAGTLTIASGSSIYGMGNIGGGATISNQGTITVSSGDMTISSGAFYNQSGGNIVVTNSKYLSMYMYGASSNQGTIDLQSGTLRLYDAFTTAEMGTITRGTSTNIEIRGALNNTSATLNKGDLNIYGSGSITGGTVVGSLNVDSNGSNRLSGVTLQGNLSLADNSDRLNVSGGLTVASGSKVTIGSSSLLYFDTGSQTFSGEVQMNSGSNLQNVAGTLTIASGSSIYGMGNINGGATISNQGTITVSSGDMTISSGAFYNQSGGNIVVTNSKYLSMYMYGASSNQGTIDLQSGTLRLYDAFTTAEMGTITRGASTNIEIRGALTNTSATLNKGNLNIYGGGSITGGTVVGSLNVDSNGSNRLSGVTLQGNLSLADNSDRLNVSGGLTIASGSKVTIGSSSLLYFDTGSQTFSGEVQMNSGSNLQNVAGTLTIASGSSIYGMGNINGGATISNQGTITVSSGDMTISSGAFYNQSGGNIVVTNSKYLSMYMYGASSNQGTIDLQSGTLRLYDAFTTAEMGTITRGASTNIEIRGALTNTSATLNKGDLNIYGGGSITGGTVVGSLNVDSNGSNRLSGVTLQGNLSLADNSDRLNVSGGLTVASGSKVTIGSSSLLYFDTGSQTFSGEVQMNSGSNLQNVAGTLTIASGSSIYGMGNINGGATISNQGTITVSAGDMTISSGAFYNQSGGNIVVTNSKYLNMYMYGASSNQGTIDLQSGTLRLYDAFTTAEMGTITRGASTSIEIRGALTNTSATLNKGTLNIYGGGSITGGTVVGSLNVDSNGSNRLSGVTLQGNLSLADNSDRLNVSGGLTVTSGSKVTIGSSSLLYFDTGAQTFSGEIQMNSGANIQNATGGNLTFSSTSNIYGLGTISGNNIVNYGKIHANVSGQTLNVTASGLINYGTIQLGVGKLQASQTVQNQSGGIIKGTGTIVANIVNYSGGHLAPGNSPGIMDIDGSLTLNAGSVLDLEIENLLGTLGTSHDFIDVRDDVYFYNGVFLNVSLSQGAIDALNLKLSQGIHQTFKILSAGTDGTGSLTITPSQLLFLNEDFLWTAYVSGKDLYLQYNGPTYIPVPSFTVSNASFGNVRVGTQQTRTVTVTNTSDPGIDPISGSIGSASANGFGSTSGDQSFSNLAINSSVSRTYSYAPTTAGSHSTTVSVSTNIGNSTSSLTGTGVTPVFSSSVAPNTLIDFGTVEAYSYNDFVLRIQNLTLDDLGNLTNLTILSAILSGIDASYFSIIGFTPGTVLGKNGYLDLLIRATNPEWRFAYRYATLTLVTDQNAAFGASGNTYVYNLTAYMVPEASTYLLLSMAFGLIYLVRFYRRKF